MLCKYADRRGERIWAEASSIRHTIDLQKFFWSQRDTAVRRATSCRVERVASTVKRCVGAGA